MKTFLIISLCAVLLSGCGAKSTMETVDDALAEPAAAVKREVVVDLPGEAAIPTMENENSRYYVCEDYEISMETFPSGDLNHTIETLSGFAPEDLTVVKTEYNGVKRYDFVWAAQGENGEQLGRAAVLDDGNYHYTMTVLQNADQTENSQIVWRTVFESFQLA